MAGQEHGVPRSIQPTDSVATTVVAPAGDGGDARGGTS